MLRTLLRTTAVLVLLPTGSMGQNVERPSRDQTLLRELAVPAPSAAGLDSAIRILDQVLELARDGEHRQAAELLDGLGDLAPTLAGWLPIFKAEMLAEAGDTSEVNSLLATMDSGSPVQAGWGWLARSRSLEVADEPAHAAELAREAAGRLEGSSTLSLAWLRAGELAMGAGTTDQARDALVRSIQADRGSRHAAKAADALQALGDLTALESYSVARVRVAQGQWREALPGLKAAPDVSGLSEEERFQSHLDLGRGYFNTRQYRLAEATFESLAETPATPPAYAARALYFIGRSAYRQGRRTEGRASLEQVAVLHPQARAARDALYLLADLDHDAGRMADAAGYYEQVMDLAPSTREADLAAMRLGGYRYQSGALDEAARIFDRRRSEAGSTESRQQAAFWAALTYEAMEADSLIDARLEEAYRADPLSYYGSQAATRIGEPLLPPGLPSGPTTPDMAELGTQLANAVVRLRVHMKVPTPGSFAFELDRLKIHFRSYEGGDYALAEALIEGGLPIQGIVAGREIQRSSDGWDLRLLRIIYPFPHRAVILREASRRNVNPYLAAGLIRQESMFDEDIESRAGAIGIMQVMPATGRELARGVGIEPYSTARLTEAEVNVVLGMTFLSEMLVRYDGTVLDALVAYNAGPTRIRRWRGMPEYGDSHLFTERIPFRETREYVKVVQKNALIYESLYGCGDGGDPCLGASASPVRGLVESDGDGLL